MLYLTSILLVCSQVCLIIKAASISDIELGRSAQELRNARMLVGAGFLGQYEDAGKVNINLKSRLRHIRSVNGESMGGRMFRMVDSNHNGRLSRSEFWNSFKFYDEDKDGQITRAEYVNTYKRVSRKPNAEHIANHAFSRGDKNGDGIIDFRECNTIFDKFDHNRDSSVSRQEYIAHWNRTMGRRG